MTRRLFRRLRCLLGFHLVYGVFADRGGAASDGRGQYEQVPTCVFCGREWRHPSA